MRLHNSAAEIPFLASFDANFPYEDRDRAQALIQEGWGISLNAACCVLNEICRPPLDGRVSRSRQLELLDVWAHGFEHELKEALLRCAGMLIDCQRLPWREAVAAMEKIGSFDAQRTALLIAYSSGDCDSEEGDVALNQTLDRIVEAWTAKGI